MIQSFSSRALSAASILRSRSPLFAIIVACCLIPSEVLIGQADEYSQAEALVRNHQWDDGLALVLKLLKSDPRNAKELNLAALALIGKGDAQQANEYLRKCLLVSPRFVPALKNLSINEYNQGEYSSAEKHLEEAAKEIPDDKIVNLYLGEIAFKQKDYRRAIQFLSRSKEFASRNASVGAHLAISYLNTGEKQKATEMLDRLAPDQFDAQSQFALGVTLAQLDMAERAIPFLESAQQRFPASYDIGFDLALTYTVAKKYDRAILTSNGLIAQGRETPELDNLLSEAYDNNNETQPAVDALRRAIALDPQDETNYLDFASLCMTHRSYGAAMKVLEAGLHAHPDSDSLIFMRGVLYGMQDEYELAEKDFQKAASLSPQHNLGFVGLGVTYLEKGNAAHAIQVLKVRLREKPNDPSLLYLYAEALLRNGAVPGKPEYVEAQKALEKSVQLNPKLCLPHVSLGSIYIDEERFTDAIAQLEQARAVDPAERSAYSHLAVAYRRQGQPEKSREILTALKEMIEQERRTTRDKMKATSPDGAGTPGVQPSKE